MVSCKPLFCGVSGAHGVGSETPIPCWGYLDQVEILTLHCLKQSSNNPPHPTNTYKPKQKSKYPLKIERKMIDTKKNERTNSIRENRMKMMLKLRNGKIKTKI